MTRPRIPGLVCLLALLAPAVPVEAAGPASSPAARAATALSTSLWQQTKSRPKPRNGLRPAPSVAAWQDGTTEAKDVDAFWNTLTLVQGDLQQRMQPTAATPADLSGFAWTVDKAAIGHVYRPQGANRFLALRLAIGNRTDQPTVVPGDSISAVIDGAPRPLAPVDETIINYGFNAGGRHLSLRECLPPKELKIPAKGIASAWLIFPDLDGSSTIPPVSLKFRLNGKEITFDVREHQRAQMKIHVERIGPRQNLALVTMGGEINPFNSQSLVDEMDRLVTQSVLRVVLRFAPDAPPLEGQIANWLQFTVANLSTRQFSSQQLPAFPAQLRELHLVKHPRGGLSNPNTGNPPAALGRFHETDVDAVAAALRTTYFTVPLDQLRQQMASGHPLARAAALIHGSSRFSAQELPLILPLTQDEDPMIRQAALRALREFDEPAALARLETAVRSGNGQDANTAIDAFADSRFAAVGQHLRDMLAAGDPALTSRIIARLAEQPRPAWSDVLLAHAVDEKHQLRIDALKALVQLDHPDIVDLLEQGLNSSDSKVRDFVFPILSRRPDERSYRLAADYVLKELANGPPDSYTLEFLSRSRDRRALPLLRDKLDQKGDKTGVINLLAALGDTDVGDRLVREFDGYSENEKTAAVNALRSLRNPRFMEVAEKALTQQQMSLVHQTINALTQLGTPEAEQLLIRTLQSPPRDTVLSNVVQGLVTLRTPAAREALIAASQSANAARRSAGKNGLQNLRNNSPARSTLLQAMQFSQQEKWREAAEMYSVAAELDDFLPEAFSGLGDANLKLEKWKEGEAAFRKAVELNPEDGHAISGLAIAEVQLDQPEQALRRIAEARPKFEKDAIFTYNIACVFGRRAERLEQQPASKERDAELAKFREQALAELDQSIKLGFNQVDWMQRDPDLKSLHKLDGFKDVVKKAEEKSRSGPAPQQSEEEEAADPSALPR